MDYFFKPSWPDISGMEIQLFITWCLVSFMAIAFFLTTVCKVPSPYGKLAGAFMDTKVNKCLGCVLSFSLDARLSWIIMESPAFLMPLYLVLQNWDTYLYLPLQNKICLGLLMAHYFNRSFIFPFLLKAPKPMPWLAPLFAFFFCALNGSAQAIQLLRHPATDVYNPMFFVGVAMFVWGMYTNIQSDAILRKLRPPGSKPGGMFEYVSTANFFGEMVEWFGYFMACGSFVAFAFVLNSAFNLVPRALQTHDWYKSKFPKYPADRKAIIPFVL
eukprot:gene1138-674_t